MFTKPFLNTDNLRAHLCLHRDGSMALGAGVGAELGVAANAHRLALVTDEPLPPEVLATVETV